VVDIINTITLHRIGSKIKFYNSVDIYMEYGPIVKAAILRENKVCSRDIMELMDINVTIASRMIKPKLPDYPPIELFFTSNDNLDLGIEEHAMENMKVRVYNAERTVCDFFKYSSRVGNDVALEVIKNYMLRKNINLQLLFEYATKLRVKKYIKPYAEVLL